jgi:hypothetical protein
VSHSLFACDLFCARSRGLIYISNANPACSCVYICKFQFRPIHPPLGDYQQRRTLGSRVDAPQKPNCRSPEQGLKRQGLQRHLPSRLSVRTELRDGNTLTCGWTVTLKWFCSRVSSARGSPLLNLSQREAEGEGSHAARQETGS